MKKYLKKTLPTSVNSCIPSTEVDWCRGGLDGLFQQLLVPLEELLVGNVYSSPPYIPSYWNNQSSHPLNRLYHYILKSKLELYVLIDYNIV